MSEGFIPAHGGYQDLLSFRKAEIVYDATVYFTRRFYRSGDRTIDQMVQAARSGKQNRRLEKDFLNEGGLRERMTRARIEERNKRQKGQKR